MNQQPESVNGLVFSTDRKSILLIQRRDVPVWVLPGGGVEQGEPAEGATIRELHEETGYHVRIVRKIGMYTPKCRLARLTYVYECSIISGKATPSNESRAVQFFPLNNLPLLPPPYLDWIEDGVANYPHPVEKIIESVSYLALFKNLIRHPILVIRFLLTKVGLTINSK